MVSLLNLKNDYIEELKGKVLSWEKLKLKYILWTLLSMAVCGIVSFIVHFPRFVFILKSTYLKLLEWVIVYVSIDVFQLIFLISVFAYLVYDLSILDKEPLKPKQVINGFLYMYPVLKIVEIIGVCISLNGLVAVYPMLYAYFMLAFLVMIYHATWDNLKGKVHIVVFTFFGVVFMTYAASYSITVAYLYLVLLRAW